MERSVKNNNNEGKNPNTNLTHSVLNQPTPTQEATEIRCPEVSQVSGGDIEQTREQINGSIKSS